MIVDGIVYVGGVRAEDGTAVEARIDGEAVASGETRMSDEGAGCYLLTIAGPSDAEEDVTVSFVVDGRQAEVLVEGEPQPSVAYEIGSVTYDLVLDELPPLQTLTIVVNGAGATDPPAGEHQFPQGTRVKLVAGPAQNSKFDGWSGAVVTSDLQTTVLMDADKTVNANFSELPISTPSPSPEGSETPASSPTVTPSSSPTPSPSPTGSPQPSTPGPTPTVASGTESDATAPATAEAAATSTESDLTTATPGSSLTGQPSGTSTEVPPSATGSPARSDASPSPSVTGGETSGETTEEGESIGATKPPDQGPDGTRWPLIVVAAVLGAAGLAVLVVGVLGLKKARGENEP